MLSHPLQRIPPFTGATWTIDTEKGPMPPERCLAYDNPRLILHGPASTRPGHLFTLQELAGYSKTTARLDTILRPWPWAVITPLDWRSPEQLLLTFGPEVDPLLYDLIHLAGRLEQLETLVLTLQPQSALLFTRC